MGLFDALGELCSMPIRVAGEINKDLQSVAKGVGKTIQKSVEKLD